MVHASVFIHICYYFMIRLHIIHVRWYWHCVNKYPWSWYVSNVTAPREERLFYYFRPLYLVRNTSGKGVCLSVAIGLIFFKVTCVTLYSGYWAYTCFICPGIFLFVLLVPYIQFEPENWINPRALQNTYTEMPPALYLQLHEVKK